MTKKILLILLIPCLILLTSCSLLPTGSNGLGSSSNTKGVFKSEDRGLSWQEKNNIKDNDKNISRININEMKFDVLDSRLLYAGSNDGLYFSDDSAENWQKIFASQVINFALNPKTRGIIYTSSGNEIYKTTNNGDDWELIYTETRPEIYIKSLEVSPFDTSKIYALTNDGNLLLSADWGSSWKSIYNFKTTIQELLIDPDNSQLMYTAVSNGLFKSIDEGKTWEEILREQKKEFPGIEIYQKLHFSNNGLIYLSKYGILKSKDNGNSWKALTLISPPGSANIKAMGFNPKDTDEIYYIVDNILYHTLDNGRNWKTKVLPVSGRVKVNSLLVDFYDPGILYLGLTQ